MSGICGGSGFYYSTCIYHPQDLVFSSLCWNFQILSYLLWTRWLLAASSLWKAFLQMISRHKGMLQGCMSHLPHKVKTWRTLWNCMGYSCVSCSCFVTCRFQWDVTQSGSFWSILWFSSQSFNTWSPLMCGMALLQATRKSLYCLSLTESRELILGQLFSFSLYARRMHGSQRDDHNECSVPPTLGCKLLHPSCRSFIPALIVLHCWCTSDGKTICQLNLCISVLWVL